jgi:hypothetical protein
VTRETRAEEIARLQKEIADRQLRLQLLVCGDPMKCVSMPAHSYLTNPLEKKP